MAPGSLLLNAGPLMLFVEVVVVGLILVLLMLFAAILFRLITWVGRD